jgi:hypothetical protein
MAAGSLLVALLQRPASAVAIRHHHTTDLTALDEVGEVWL